MASRDFDAGSHGRGRGRSRPGSGPPGPGGAGSDDGSGAVRRDRDGGSWSGKSLDPIPHRRCVCDAQSRHDVRQLRDVPGEGMKVRCPNCQGYTPRGSEIDQQALAMASAMAAPVAPNLSGVSTSAAVAINLGPPPAPVDSGHGASGGGGGGGDGASSVCTRPASRAKRAPAGS